MQFLRRSTSIVLSFVYVCSNVIFAHAGETNLWVERACVVAANSGGLNRLLALPKPVLGTRVPDPGSMTNLAAPDSFREALSALSSADVRVESMVAGDPHLKPVVLVQDIHLNPEAQNHIANALIALTERAGVRKVGVEGAFHELPLDPLRHFENPAVMRTVAKSLLDHSQLGAPSYVGIMTGGDVRMIGIDHRDFYDQNVKSYLDAQNSKHAVTRHVMKSTRRNNADVPRETKKFMEQRRAYRTAEMGLGEYLICLKAIVPSAQDQSIGTFLDAYRLEKQMRFSVVEQQRQVVLSTLSGALSKQELSELVAVSVAVEQGQRTQAQLYANVEALLREHNLNLKAYPDFQMYIRYVKLAEALKVPQLLLALDRIEAAAAQRLTALENTQHALEQDEFNLLAGKLIDFSLTPAEWERYQYLRSRVRPADVSAMQPFERFYEFADIRSRWMVKSIARWNEPTALVVGGFHTPAISKLLEKMHRPFLVVTPRVTKIETASGSGYLSAFSQRKTPIETLFRAQKLWINPETLNSNATLMAQVRPSALARALGQSTVAFRWAGRLWKFHVRVLDKFDASKDQISPALSLGERFYLLFGINWENLSFVPLVLVKYFAPEYFALQLIAYGVGSLVFGWGVHARRSFPQKLLLTAVAMLIGVPLLGDGPLWLGALGSVSFHSWYNSLVLALRAAGFENLSLAVATTARAGWSDRTWLKMGWVGARTSVIAANNAAEPRAQWHQRYPHYLSDIEAFEQAVGSVAQGSVRTSVAEFRQTHSDYQGGAELIANAIDAMIRLHGGEPIGRFGNGLQSVRAILALFPGPDSYMEIVTRVENGPLRRVLIRYVADGPKSGHFEISWETLPGSVERGTSVNLHLGGDQKKRAEYLHRLERELRATYDLNRVLPIAVFQDGKKDAGLLNPLKNFRDINGKQLRGYRLAGIGGNPPVELHFSAAGFGVRDRGTGIDDVTILERLPNPKSVNEQNVQTSTDFEIAYKPSRTKRPEKASRLAVLKGGRRVLEWSVQDVGLPEEFVFELPGVARLTQAWKGFDFGAGSDANIDEVRNVIQRILNSKASFNDRVQMLNAFMEVLSHIDASSEGLVEYARREFAPFLAAWKKEGLVVFPADEKFLDLKLPRSVKASSVVYVHRLLFPRYVPENIPGIEPLNRPFGSAEFPFLAEHPTKTVFLVDFKDSKQNMFEYENVVYYSRQFFNDQLSDDNPNPAPIENDANSRTSYEAVNAGREPEPIIRKKTVPKVDEQTERARAAMEGTSYMDKLHASTRDYLLHSLGTLDAPAIALWRARLEHLWDILGHNVAWFGELVLAAVQGKLPLIRLNPSAVTVISADPALAGLSDVKVANEGNFLTIVDSGGKSSLRPVLSEGQLGESMGGRAVCLYDGDLFLANDLRAKQTQWLRWQNGEWTPFLSFDSEEVLSLAGPKLLAFFENDTYAVVDDIDGTPTWQLIPGVELPQLFQIGKHLFYWGNDAAIHKCDWKLGVQEAVGEIERADKALNVRVGGRDVALLIVADVQEMGLSGTHSSNFFDGQQVYAGPELPIVETSVVAHDGDVWMIDSSASSGLQQLKRLRFHSKDPTGHTDDVIDLGAYTSPDQVYSSSGRLFVRAKSAEGKFVLLEIHPSNIVVQQRQGNAVEDIASISGKESTAMQVRHNYKFNRWGRRLLVTDGVEVFDIEDGRSQPIDLPFGDFPFRLGSEFFGIESDVASDSYYLTRTDENLSEFGRRVAQLSQVPTYLVQKNFVFFADGDAIKVLDKQNGSLSKISFNGTFPKFFSDPKGSYLSYKQAASVVVELVPDDITDAEAILGGSVVFEDLSNRGEILPLRHQSLDLFVRATREADGSNTFSMLVNDNGDLRTVQFQGEPSQFSWASSHDGYLYVINGVGDGATLWQGQVVKQNNTFIFDGHQIDLAAYGFKSPAYARSLDDGLYLAAKNSGDEWRLLRLDPSLLTKDQFQEPAKPQVREGWHVTSEFPFLTGSNLYVGRGAGIFYVDSPLASRERLMQFTEGVARVVLERPVIEALTVAEKMFYISGNNVNVILPNEKNKNLGAFSKPLHLAENNQYAYLMDREQNQLLVWEMDGFRHLDQALSIPWENDMEDSNFFVTIYDQQKVVVQTNQSNESFVLKEGQQRLRIKWNGSERLGVNHLTQLNGKTYWKLSLKNGSSLVVEGHLQLEGADAEIVGTVIKEVPTGQTIDQLFVGSGNLYVKLGNGTIEKYTPPAAPEEEYTGDQRAIVTATPLDIALPNVMYSSIDQALATDKAVYWTQSTRLWRSYQGGVSEVVFPHGVWDMRSVVPVAKGVFVFVIDTARKNTLFYIDDETTTVSTLASEVANLTEQSFNDRIIYSARTSTINIYDGKSNRAIAGLTNSNPRFTCLHGDSVFFGLGQNGIHSVHRIDSSGEQKRVVNLDSDMQGGLFVLSENIQVVVDDDGYGVVVDRGQSHRLEIEKRSGRESSGYFQIGQRLIRISWDQSHGENVVVHLGRWSRADGGQWLEDETPLTNVRILSKGDPLGLNLVARDNRVQFFGEVKQANQTYKMQIVDLKLSLEPLPVEKKALGFPGTFDWTSAKQWLTSFFETRAGFISQDRAGRYRLWRRLFFADSTLAESQWDETIASLLMLLPTGAADPLTQAVVRAVRDFCVAHASNIGDQAAFFSVLEAAMPRLHTEADVVEFLERWRELHADLENEQRLKKFYAMFRDDGHLLGVSVFHEQQLRNDQIRDPILFLRGDLPKLLPEKNDNEWQRPSPASGSVVDTLVADTDSPLPVAVLSVAYDKLRNSDDDVKSGKPRSRLQEVDTITELREIVDANKGADLTAANERIRSTTRGQEKNKMVRELVQNARDAIRAVIRLARRTLSFKKIKIWSFERRTENPSEAESVRRFEDAAGMDLGVIAGALLVPGSSTKEFLEGATGLFGVGFFTATDDYDRIDIRTGYGGRVFYLSLAPDPSGKFPQLIRFVEANENWEGTVIDVVKRYPRDLKRYLKAMAFAQDARRQVGAVADTQIDLNDRSLNEKWEAEESVPVNDVDDEPIGTSTVSANAGNTIKRVTHDGLEVSFPYETLMELVPKPIAEFLLARGFRIELPADVPLTEDRSTINNENRYLPQLQRAVLSASLRLSLRLYFTRDVVPPLISDNFMSSEKYDVGKAIEREIPAEVIADAQRLNSLTPSNWSNVDLVGYAAQDSDSDAVKDFKNKRLGQLLLLLRITIPARNGLPEDQTTLWDVREEKWKSMNSATPDRRHDRLYGDDEKAAVRHKRDALQIQQTVHNRVAGGIARVQQDVIDSNAFLKLACDFYRTLFDRMPKGLFDKDKKLIFSYRQGSTVLADYDPEFGFIRINLWQVLANASQWRQALLTDDAHVAFDFFRAELNTVIHELSHQEVSGHTQGKVAADAEAEFPHWLRREGLIPGTFGAAYSRRMLWYLQARRRGSWSVVRNEIRTRHSSLLSEQPFNAAVASAKQQLEAELVRVEGERPNRSQGENALFGAALFLILMRTSFFSASESAIAPWVPMILFAVILLYHKWESIRNRTPLVQKRRAATFLLDRIEAVQKHRVDRLAPAHALDLNWINHPSSDPRAEARARVAEWSDDVEFQQLVRDEMARRHLDSSRDRDIINSIVEADLAGPAEVSPNNPVAFVFGSELPSVESFVCAYRRLGSHRSVRVFVASSYARTEIERMIVRMHDLGFDVRRMTVHFYDAQSAVRDYQLDASAIEGDEKFWWVLPDGWSLKGSQNYVLFSALSLHIDRLKSLFQAVATAA